MYEVQAMIDNVANKSDQQIADEIALHLEHPVVRYFEALMKEACVRARAGNFELVNQLCDCLPTKH